MYFNVQFVKPVVENISTGKRIFTKLLPISQKTHKFANRKSLINTFTKKTTQNEHKITNNYLVIGNSFDELQQLHGRLG